METENRLIGAILIQAVKDWDHPVYHADVQEFLGSSWFFELAEALDLEPADLRAMLRSGRMRTVSLRAAYRRQVRGK